MPRPQQQIRWRSFQGRNTQFDPEALQEDDHWLEESENFDGYRRFQAWGKIPGSSVQSPDLGGAVRSLHHFEYFDLTGTLQRERLALANGKLWRLDSPAVATAVGSGLVTESLRAMRAFDRLHLASPNQDPFKWDGDSVTRWGLKAPGSEEFALESFDDSSIFTVSAGDAASDASASQDGGGSTQLDKDSTASDEAYIEVTYGAALDLTAGADLGGLYVFIPHGLLGKLKRGGKCLELWLGSGSANARKHQWDLGDLQEGWVFLSIIPSDPSDTVGAPPALNNVTYLRALVRTDDAGFTFAGALFDHLHLTDEGAPVAGLAAGSGGVGGTVSYRVVYRSKYGHLSNAGPPSGSVTVPAGTSGKVLVQGVPISPDPQTAARRLYRDQDGDSLWRFVAELPDNTTTSYEDAADSAALSSETPPLAGDDQDDNRPPPRMRDVVIWEGHAFGVNAGNPFIVEMMDFQEPESAPLVNQRAFDDEVKALRRTTRGVFAISADRLFVLQGNSPADFAFVEIHPETGTSGERAAENVHATVAVWHDDGPYLHDGINPWYIGNPIRDLIDGLDPESFGDLHIAHDRARYGLVYFLPSAAGGPYERALVYSYGASAGVVSPDGYGVDPQDLRVGAWSEIVFPASINPLCSEVVERTSEKPELWIGCDDGRVYRLRDPDATTWAVGSDGSEIVSCKMATVWKPFLEPSGSYYGVGYPRELLSEGRGQPREVVVSGYAPQESTWTLRLRTADGPGSPYTEVVREITLGPGAAPAVVPVDSDDTEAAWCQVVLENAEDVSPPRISSITVKYIPTGYEGAE